MDQPLTDRRTDGRRPWPEGQAARATLRPGCVVAVVDVSAGGVLVEAAKPLRPGARVHLQLVTAERTFTLSAHVVRCVVWSLDDRSGAIYRGALRFEQPFDPPVASPI